MKKITLLVILILSVTITTFAQDSTLSNKKTAKTQKSSSAEQKDKYEQLGLTNDQQQKLNTINSEEKTKKEAIENNKDLSDDQKKEQLKTLKKDAKNQKSSLLTSDQKIKLKMQKSQNKTTAPQNTVPPANTQQHT